MERLRVWGVFSLIVLTSSQNVTHSPGSVQPSYLLLAPRVLRPGVPPSVSVTVLTTSPVSVSARIVHGNKTVSSRSAAIKRESTRLLNMPPISESESNFQYPYILEVKGHVGNIQVFSNSTELHFDPKGHSTFIQTDKLNYLPGQVVKIRVVSIHHDGKPYVSPLDIIIRNPRGNLLRHWLAADSVLGVVSKEFQLSENPPQGEWTVVVTVNSVSSEKHFNVAPCVLPKFEVVIFAPDVIHRKDALSCSVTAKYSYGKPVRGYMNIIIMYHFHGVVGTYYENREIDGTEYFRFDTRNYYPLNNRILEMFSYDEYVNDEFITIVANVTEHLTGFTYNTTTKVSWAKYRYKLYFDEYSKILRPSLNLGVKLKISSYNNQPLSIEDQQKTIYVSVIQHKQSQWNLIMDHVDEMDPHSSNMSGPSQIHPHLEEMALPVPADGVIPLNVKVMNETEILIIDASLEDSQNTLHLSRSYTSPSQSYLQIQKPSTPTKVDSPLLLHIERNFPETAVHYIVKSRGQVVSAGKASGDLTLIPEISWAPLACIVVYCVHSSGEIISDVIQLPIDQTLQNQVSLSWSSTEKRPADEVTLNIKVAEPGSLVGILVGDKTTQWTGSRNDITNERVLEEMMEYSTFTNTTHSGTLGMGDPYSIFKSCDLVALTDANLDIMEHPTKPIVWEETHPLYQTHGPAGKHDQPWQCWNFPETWIWMDTNTGSLNGAAIPLTVPHSIKTWTATAFVMSKNLGLGIIERPAVLTVFKEFFLSLDLPASIIRGEELLLEIIVFNYLPMHLEVRLIVEQSDAFEFTSADNELLFTPNFHQVTIRSEKGITVLIPIKPLVLGEIPISVKAMTSTASDFVRKTVLVKAEGLEQSFTTSLLFEVSPSRSSLSRNVTFTFPPDAVEGSKRVSVTAVGGILGPSIQGLDSLIRMPHGCGEQNMINFAPNVYVLQYLTATSHVDKDTADRARDYMMKGYEQELSYQRVDGSFSAFGDQDSSGSTWLTAFVLRCFLQARPFVSIDTQVLRRAAAWLGAQQGADGRFVEPGRVIHTELQGGLDGPVSLTAYVLMALLEDSDIHAQYWSQVSSALMFLETRLALEVSSNYSLSLLTYALALSGSSSAASALSTLIGRAQIVDSVPMWSFPDDSLSSSWQPRSVDIEMVSYVLLSQHKLGHVADGLSLMKWLSQQRNDRGGFGSTQDTVLALQALSKFAALGSSHDFNLTVRVKTSASTTVASFHIRQDNYLLQQSQQLELDEDLQLQVTAEGHGLALFQLNVFYNIRNKELMRRRRDAGEREAFLLHIELYDTKINSAHLYVCSRLSEGLGLTATGMAILEVGLLSGFSLPQDGVRTDDVLKKVETQPGKVVLYLDSVTTQETCLWIPLVVEYTVGKVQDAAVVIYDYYEPRRRTVRTYKSEWRSNVSTCFFCGKGCSNCMIDNDEFVYALEAASRSSHNLLLTSFLPALLVLFLNVFSL